MSEYKGKRYSYFELVKIFNTEIYEKQGKKGQPRIDKYFACLNLIQDLKVSFKLYYEYELLREVLQDYMNVLSEQLGQRKIRDFNPTETVVPSSNLVFNTPSTNRQRFGEVQLDISMLTQTYAFQNLKEENYDIIFRIIKYSIDNNEIMYNLQYTPFVGTEVMQLVLNYYLYELQLKNYTKFPQNTENFKLFPLNVYGAIGYEFEKMALSINEIYNNKVHEYLQTHNNCFTLLPAGIPGHFLTVLVHKTVNEMNIYVIDSNNTSTTSDPKNLTAVLEQHFKKKHVTLSCRSYYMCDIKYPLNFGGTNIYEAGGFCVLVGYIFMDILYRNIVFYNKLPFNAKHDDVFNFINKMKTFCVENFAKNHDNAKWKLICFNYSYRVMKSTKLFETDGNKPLISQYFTKVTIDEVKQKQNDQNVLFSFKSKLREFFVIRGYNVGFIGINWQSDPNYAEISQKDNGCYYFIPELMLSKNYILK